MAQKTWKRSNSTTSSKGHPDDIFPLVLTSATQELFGCSVDADVTQKSPYKLLKKDDILQDIKTRAAVSDFSPVKQIVLDYPEEEMLLVFDADFTYGQNFYLVLTPEAKDRVFKPLDTTSNVFDAEVNETPQPRHWISLGSEKEIEELPKESKEKLRRFRIRLDRPVGLPVCFEDSEVNYLEIPSYQDSRFNIKILSKDCGIQSVPQKKTSSSQTHRAATKNSFTQYKPREFSTEEIENILQSESLKNFCATVTPRMLHALQQEEIMNVFIDWKAMFDDCSREVSDDLRVHQVFRDQKYIENKKMSCLNWHPTIYGVIAVASVKRREKQSEKTAPPGLEPAHIIFYSFSDLVNAQLLLEYPEDILSFEFCPSNPNIIAGGCVNGQVVLWDISAHVIYLQAAQTGCEKFSTYPETFDSKDNKETEAPVVPFCAASALGGSHKAPVTDVQWLPQTFQVNKMGLPLENKTNVSVQIVTCAPDCTLRFWDVRRRNLLTPTPLHMKQSADMKPPKKTYSIPETFQHLTTSWKPLFVVLLSKIETEGKYFPLKFSFEHHICTTEKSPKSTWTEILPDYSQLRFPSSEKLKPMEDVNTKLFLGTENGEIIYTDWKMESGESNSPNSAKPLLSFNTHHWLVTAMQRSPFFKDIVLTTGGWNFAIWKEGVMEGPLLESQCSGQECTAGCWSLSRPAVFFIGKDDGSVEVWDLLKNTSEPVHLQADISKGSITCMKPCAVSAKQHFLAVADDLGVLVVFEIPKSLLVTSKHEIVSMRKYLEHETEALKDETKFFEVWTKQMKEKKKQMEPDKPVLPLDNIDPEKEYNDLLLEEERLLRSLGIRPTAEEK